MSRVGLSKTRIISGLQCPKRLYLEVHRPEFAEVSDETERMFSNGHLVGEIARSQQRGGKLISCTDDLQAALAETQALLKAEPATVLFEPAFQHGGVLIRADILSRFGSKAQLVEVKSSTGIKDYHYKDAAIQYWVLTGAGIPLSSVSISHINNEFVYSGDGDYRGLFRTVIVTEDILPLVEQVPLWITEFQKVLAGEVPEISIGKQCASPFACPFSNHCSEGQPDTPVEMLPRGGKVVELLLSEGFRDLRDVPFERFTSAIHQRVWRATKSGRAELDPNVRELVRAFDHSRYYLDFETIQFAVPIWPGTRPYQQLPFQWSCHIENASGHIEHKEFLDVSGEPPMRAFAERLIEALGNSGAVVVYGHFEEMILRQLIARYPDLGAALSAIVLRIKNLLPIIRDHYYHPAMKGSWSLKAVLPAVAPDLSYAALGEVQDGTAAQAAYLEAIELATSADRREQLINDLRSYCKMDTIALVRLCRFLAT
jgi:Domain of unknown function(DUF2779)